MPKIKYFIMDVDGTLIDRKIYMGEEGELCKAYIAFCSGIDYSAEKGLSTPFSSKNKLTSVTFVYCRLI